jgi:hypothetical protein
MSSSAKRYKTLVQVNRAFTKRLFSVDWKHTTSTAVQNKLRNFLMLPEQIDKASSILQTEFLPGVK